MMKGQKLPHIETLIDQYQNDLFHFCLSLTKSKVNAEDLFQDTWIKVVTKINQFNSSYDFKNWLFKIALNTYKDGYRKQKREKEHSICYVTCEEQEKALTNVISHFNSPETEVVHKEANQHLKALVEALPDKFRLPVIMFYYHELSLKEISRLLKIPLGTVKSRLNKSKKLLKEQMEEKDDGFIRQNVV